MSGGRRREAAVVAGWFLGNAVLTAILTVFGESAFAVTLYAASTALPAVFAVAVLHGGGRNPEPEESFALPGGPGWAVVAALGLVLVGLGSIFGIWLIIIGAALVLAASYELVRTRSVPPQPASPSEVPDGAA